MGEADYLMREVERLREERNEWRDKYETKDKELKQMYAAIAVVAKAAGLDTTEFIESWKRKS